MPLINKMDKKLLEIRIQVNILILVININSKNTKPEERKWNTINPNLKSITSI